MGKSLKGKELGRGISQRKDGIYQGRFTNRFGKRECIYNSNLEELRKKLRAEQVANDTETNIVKKDMTVDEWYILWLDIYKVNCRNSSKNTYTTSYKRVKKELGKIKLIDLKLASIQRAISKIPSANAQGDTLDLLISMLDKAIDSELLLHNPAKKVVIAKKESKKERRVLTIQETEIFLEEMKEQANYFVILIALRTGMRIGEILGLTWDDISFRDKLIYVRKTLCVVKNEKTEFEFHDTKTESGKRRIPMLDDVCAIFRQQYEKKQSIIKNGKIPLIGFENLVFVTRNNTPVDPSCIRQTIRKAVKRINEKNPQICFESLSPHTLRHTFATRCIEQGMNIKTLQKLLGHSTLAMTMDLYCHVTQETLCMEMEKMTKFSVVL